MNIEDLLIEAKNTTQAFASISNNELDISCSEENLLNQKYFFEIYKTNEYLKKIEKIGEIEMTYMDVQMAEETGYDVSMLFDLIDSEKQGVYQYLFNDDEPNDEYVGTDLDVIYIDKIYLQKKYRNMGIGSTIINELPNLIRNILKLRPGCLVLLANPFEFQGKEFVSERNTDKIEKLIEFYQKNGFERIEDTQYLVINMDYR